MNTKMIRYILGKMLGVEAVLLLLPALVSLIYREFSGIYFLIPAGIIGVMYGIRSEEAREQEHIREGRDGHCRQCVDSVVVVRSAALLAVGEYPVLSGCFF